MTRRTAYGVAVNGFSFSYYVHCTKCANRRFSPRTYWTRWGADRAADRHSRLHRDVALPSLRWMS